MKRAHVLFVCIGNICRSAMAEAMARKYGSDVLVASSAGLAPAPVSHELTRTVLAEINIDMGDHIPRRLSDVDLSRYDLIVNMSGSQLSGDLGVPVENWDVKDPYGRPEAEFRAARADIEMRVMQLILRLRTGKLTFNRKPAWAIDSGRPSSRQ
jgi:arsenate reductase (thioredoxin)